MLVVPVIDLQRGIAVQGRAGNRAAYRPVCSVLATSSDPVDLAAGMIRQLGLRQVYVADLDAIEGQSPTWPVLDRLLDLGLRLWLDVGIRNLDQVVTVHDRCGDQVDLVLGLETLEDLPTVAAALSVVGPTNTIVSLDLQDGRPMSPRPEWQQAEPVTIAQEVSRLGVRRMILLDICRVGMGQGTGTQSLVRQLRQRDSQLQITCGGGIRDLHEVEQLARSRCDAVLVASALHRGQFGRREIEQIANLTATK